MKRWLAIPAGVMLAGALFVAGSYGTLTAEGATNDRAKTNGVPGDIVELQERLLKLEQSMGVQAQEYSALVKKVEQQAATIQANSTSIQGLQALTSNQANTIKQLQAENVAYHAEIGDLRAIYGNQQAELTSLKQKTGQLELAVSGFETSQAAQDQALQSLQLNTTATTQTVVTLRDSITSIYATTTSNHSAVQSLTQLVSQLQPKVEVAANQVDVMKADVTTLRSELGSLKTTVSQLQTAPATGGGTTVPTTGGGTTVPTTGGGTTVPTTGGGTTVPTTGGGTTVPTTGGGTIDTNPNVDPNAGSGNEPATGGGTTVPTTGGGTVPTTGDGTVPTTGGGSVPTTPAPAFLTIEENNASIAYTGAWGYHSNALNSNGVGFWTTSANSSMSYTFTGTGVRVLGMKYFNRGLADIYIDNKFVETIDSYAPSMQAKVVLFERTNLTYGPHTIKIVAKGEKSLASTGTFVYIDALQITSGGQLPDMPNTSTPSDLVIPAGAGLIEESAAAVKYVGAWSTHTDARNTAGAAKFRETANGSAELLFTGTSIQLVGFKAPNRGLADIYIDDQLVQTVDQYATTQQPKSIFFEKTGLSSGTHKIRVVVKGAKSAAATSTIIHLDGFIVGQ